MNSAKHRRVAMTTHREKRGRAQTKKEQRYKELEATKELLALCRSDIVAARLMLAITNHLTVEQQAELWELIDAGELFIRMVAEDYGGQMEQIDRELEMELQH